MCMLRKEALGAWDKTEICELNDFVRKQREENGRDWRRGLTEESDKTKRVSMTLGCCSLILNSVTNCFFHSHCLSLRTLTADCDWWRTGFCHMGSSKLLSGWKTRHGLWWFPLCLPSPERGVHHAAWSYELHTTGLKAMRHTPQGGEGKEGEAWHCFSGSPGI